MSRGIFRRYETDAKLGIFYAVQLASHRGQTCITPEDILLALTWRNHADDCEFRGLKDDADKLWSFVGVSHLPITRNPYESKSLPLNDAAKRVLAYAAMEAEQDGEYWIDLDHMLRGILLENGAAAGALRQSGWTVERIKEAAERGRKRYPSKPIPWNWRLRSYWVWIAIAVFVGLLTITAAIS